MLDPAGNVFVASPVSRRVRRIDAQSGVITTFAGTGRPKAGADGLPANAFGLVEPTSLAFGPDGALFVADPGSHRVLRINPITTEVTTALGNSQGPGAGQDGDDAGPGFRLNGPVAVATDSAGALYVSDIGNLRVLRADPVTNVVNVVAGGGPVEGVPEDVAPATSTAYPVHSLAVDSIGQMALSVGAGDLSTSQGILLVATNRTVRHVYDQGALVAFDGEGALYFSNSSTYLVIRRDPATGSQMTVAGGGRDGFLGDGGLATNAYLRVGSIAGDATGNIFVLDAFSERVRRVDRNSGLISTIGGKLRLELAGDGGLATSANIRGVASVAWVEERGLCMMDGLARGIRVVDPESGLLTTPIGNGPPSIAGVSPQDGDPALGAKIAPRVLGAGGSGRVLFSNVPTPRSRHQVWAATRSGKLERVAGFGLDYSDGIAALDCSFGYLSSIAETPAGDTLVVDSFTRRVRLLDRRTGLIRTVAGRIHEGSDYSGEGGPAQDATLASPSTAAVAPTGEVYFIDANCIRKIDAAGIISTVVSGVEPGVPEPGPISDVRFGAIGGLAFDASGDLYVSDSLNGVVVRLELARDRVVYVAGIVGSTSLSGDGGLATQASLGAPSSLCFDPEGNLYIRTVVLSDGAGSEDYFYDGDCIIRVVRSR